MTLRILGGEWKGRPLQSPKSSPTRPTQGILRQAVFNICQAEIAGSRFLDLFAGSGAMGLEALSRGAERAVFVENSRPAVRSIRENISLFQAESRSELLPMDIWAALRRLAGQNFDIIYADPPYAEASVIAIRLLEEVEKNHLLAAGGSLFIEESTQGKEIIYESPHLQRVSVRRFGIARLIHLSHI